MKRTFLIAGLVLSCAAVAGVTSYSVVRMAQPSAGAVRSEVSSSDFVSAKVGTQFTSYEKEKYPDLTYAAENAVKAVVNIENVREVTSRSRSRQERYFDPFFEFFGYPQGYGESGQPQSRSQSSYGSGVIISDDGYIVTNNHVIENNSRLKVKLNDNRVFEAKVVGADPTTDVALIKIEATGLPTLPFGNSDDLRLGEWVLAIGSPYDLRSTVTAGIVSAKARQLGVIPNEFSIESFIQTDAAVNPGNSGGALVNTAGELVGINTVLVSPTGSYAGYSFAVPETIVKKVVVDLKEYGVVQRAMLGVRYSVINEDFIDQRGEELGITEPGGVYVASVEENGAAKAAGVKEGDIITAIDGVALETSASVSEIIGRHRPNDKVTLSVKRGKEVKQIDVVLRNKAGKVELVTKDDVDAAEALGGKFAEVSEKVCRELKIDGGIRVVSIREGGILSKARVREGFVITHINDREVRSVSALNRITSKITSIDGVYPNGRAVSYTLVE